MQERKPNRYISIHNHSHHSCNDGLGEVDDHFKWCIENGIPGHAITEHGHFNSFARAFLTWEKWHKEGKEFRYLPGIEAYFHPDLDQWRLDKLKHDEEKVDKKKRKKEVETQLSLKRNSVDDIVDVNVVSDEEAEDSKLVVENEEETKSTKHFNPINRRHHLVLLPKNSKGLEELFHLTSQSFMDGYYRFPRIDMKMVKNTITKGNVLASSACVGGFPAWSIYRALEEFKFDELNVGLLENGSIKEKCVLAVSEAYGMLVDMFGPNDTYLELQFNKLAAQDIVNLSIIEFARRSGLRDKLVVTCDAHYYHPDVWREREIYKKLAYVKFDQYSPDLLPKSKEDLKCELYPKNNLQTWDEYKAAKLRSKLYDDDGLVCDAIERGYDIAFNEIGDVKPDRTIKLPKKLVPKDRTPIEHLSWMCIEGMKKRGLRGKKEYVERLKEELDVISFHNTAEYFITLAKVIELAKKVTLVGPGRGSGCGSLINYVLGICDLDPIVWDLPFSRFLSKYRVGAPDVDTDIGDRDKVLEILRGEFGDENVIPISTYNLLKTKSLLKDLSKFYGIPFDEANAATATVEHEVRRATLKEGDDKNLFVLTYDDAMKHSSSFRTFMEKHPEVANSMKILFKQNRSLGRHAGGCLIGDDVPKKMPLITSGGEVQSPWCEGMSVKELEKIATWIKYDILGLTTLRLIENTIKLILQKQGNKNPTFEEIRTWFEENMGVNKIDHNDQKVYEHVYHAGRWPSIFQCTTPPTQKFFKKAKPKSITDIAVLTSIWRPGPLAAGVHELYLKHEKEPYDWGHQLVNDTLKETRQLIIFQEQIMLLANKVGGFPMEQCDEIRRAIMKRSISGGEEAKKKARELEDDFVKGAMKNGLTEILARDIYQKILWFSGYAFNKSLYFLQDVNTYNQDGTVKRTKPISDVVVGDLLLTRDEKSKKNTLTKVKDKHDHGVLELVEVELTTGEKIKCTLDHKFRTVETGEMLPLWIILKRNMSVIVNDAEKYSCAKNRLKNTKKDA